MFFSASLPLCSSALRFSRCNGGKLLCSRPVLPMSRSSRSLPYCCRHSANVVARLVFPAIIPPIEIAFRRLSSCLPPDKSASIPPTLTHTLIFCISDSEYIRP
jgi:hypothetical protein